MNNCKYFCPGGEEIAGKDGKSAKKRFIEFYSEKYRKENEKQWDSELMMEKLLKRDHNTSLDKNDIASILCWKVCRDPKSLKKGEFHEYRINSRNGKIIVGDELMEAPEFKSLNEPERKTNETNETDETNERCAKEFVRHLVNFCYSTPQSSSGAGERARIGFVYALAILFIVTKGAYPIYDRYAYVGLKSVCSGGNPTDEQSKITESYYCSNMFHSAYHHGEAPITGVEFDRAWEEYMEYKRLLMAKDTFGDVYDEHGFQYRDVDRALWAYGHLFYVPYKKKKKDGSNNE